jgi:iron complex outermembrane recepter protein
MRRTALFRRWFNTTVFATAIAGAFAPVAVSAQDGGSPPSSPDDAQAGRPAQPATDAFGDIVVTARRREETLQSVPVSVTALSGAALEQRGYQSIVDIQQTTPNLAFTPGTGGTSSQISGYIRGVGEFDYIITSDPAVAVFVDGVYQARPFGAITSLLGIERIEVLRGPQGSLFGKNTIGGAINIVTTKPTGSESGSIDLRVGSYWGVQGRAAYDGRATPDLTYSMSLLGRRADGWQDNTAGNGDLGNENQLAGRIALRWQPAGLDALLSVDGLHQRQNSAAHSTIAFQPTFFSGLFSTFIAPCCTAPSTRSCECSTASLNIDNADAINSSLTLDFAAGSIGVKSITGVRHTDVTFARDGDASFENYVGDRQHITATQVSQELQFTRDDLLGGRGRMLVGLFGFYEHADQRIRLVTADGLYPRLLAAGFDPGLAAALDFNVDFRLRQNTTNFAGFGNFTYELSDALTLDFGGRYTWERKDLDESAIRVFAGTPLVAGTPNFRLRKSWSNFSPKFTVSYQAAADVLGYVTFSRGFRSGGFNGRPTAPEEIGSYDPEKLTSYEVGLKTQLFDRRVRFNTSVYYNRYNDQQVLTSFLGANGLIVARTENAGRSRMWGFEAEAQARVNDLLTLDGSLGYINARYLRYLSRNASGQLVDLSNLRLKHTPPWTGSLGATLTVPLDDRVTGRFRIDGAYQDAQYIDVPNTPLLRAERNVILNASVNLDLGERWSVGVEGQNLTDRQVIKEGFDAATSFGFTEAYYNPPRRIYASVRYRF